MRRIYCGKCEMKVAGVKAGSVIRRGAVMLCAKCYERLDLTDKMAEFASKASKDVPIPDFLRDLIK